MNAIIFRIRADSAALQKHRTLKQETRRIRRWMGIDVGTGGTPALPVPVREALPSPPAPAIRSGRGNHP